MAESRAWDWKKEKDPTWLIPSEESCYLAQRWKQKGYERILDFGCGLGRHAVFFARNGFSVSAFDLSAEAVEHLRRWAAEENLSVGAAVADMLAPPYPDRAFDAIFAFHVVSHTDSAGVIRILGEIFRMLKPGGELYLTLCSKETWSFQDAGYPRLDPNTVVKTDPGPEEGVPHFYADLDDVLSLLKDFTVEKIRHTDDCYFSGRRQKSRHYFILARK